MSARRPNPLPATNLSRTGYMPGLDGLRAVAVVAVMVYHADHEWLSGGFLGVEVFFVISGYLITLLLIGEHERQGRIDLRQFWLRRFRRLLPALFVMMSLLAVYLAVFQRDQQGATRGDFLGGIGYVSNWYQIFVGQGYAAVSAFVPLRHLWSLAVEEQFYLVWPIVAVLVMRRGRDHLPRVALWLFGIAAAITVTVGVLFAGGEVPVQCAPGETGGMNGYWVLFGRCISTNEALYLGTFSRAGGLLIGAGFAMLWRPAAIMRGPLRRKARQLDLLALLGLGGLAGLAWWLTLSGPAHTINGSIFDARLFRGGFLLTGITTVLVIAAVTHRGSLTGKALGNPLFVWVGTRSYGLYLYHWPIYQIIRKQAGVALSWQQFAVAMLVTVPITELSYRFVEVPIRQGRLGEWLRGQRTPRTAQALARRRRAVLVASTLSFATVAAGVSIAVADNPCTGASCGSTAAPSTDPTTSSPATRPSGPVDTSGGTTTTSSTTTTTIPFASIGPIAVGESVMKGAVNQLVAGGFTVNAAENRGPRKTAELLASLREQNSLGPIVVVQVGTNGTISDAQYDAIVAEAPAASTLYFLTVRADKAEWIDGNNERIRALPARHSNVRVIDWRQESEQITDQLCAGDGRTHLTCSTAAPKFYANMIFTAVGMPDKVIS